MDLFFLHFSDFGDKFIKISFFPLFFSLGYLNLVYAAAITNSVRYIQHAMISVLAVEAWVPEGTVGS